MKRMRGNRSSFTAIRACVGVIIVVLLLVFLALPSPKRKPPAKKVVAGTDDSSCTPLLQPLTPTKIDFCVVTRVKNSAEWIPEWIEYHNLLGVGRFFIVDDCSTDDGATVSILAYYKNLGILEYFAEPEVHPCGLPDRKPDEDVLIGFAYTQAQAAGCDWVAVIDIDEYISLRDDVDFSMEHGIIPILRRAVLPYMKLGWWSIGSEGHETKPNGLTIENYKRGIFESYHSKTLARTGLVKEWAYSLFPTELYPQYSCLFGPIRKWQLKEIESEVVTINGKADRVPITPIFLKHYIYRSWEEYQRSRGASQLTSNSDKNPWFNNKEKWRKGNLSTFEFSPAFTSQMATAVRLRLDSRSLPRVPYLPQFMLSRELASQKRPGVQY